MVGTGAKSMRLDRNLRSSIAAKTAVFAIVTLLAATTMLSLFVILKRAPLTHRTSATYYIPLSCLLPWLSGCVFWFKVRKRAKLGIADGGATRFCYDIIIMMVTAAYVAIIQFDGLLLWVLTRAK
jgi:hypothetical protein